MIYVLSVIIFIETVILLSFWYRFSRLKNYTLEIVKSLQKIVLAEDMEDESIAYLAYTYGIDEEDLRERIKNEASKC